MRILAHFTRRALMAGVSLSLILGLSAAFAQAAKFPDRPVKLIVTYPPEVVAYWS